MPVVKCPCGQTLKVADVGGRFRCPLCRQVLAVPATPRRAMASKVAMDQATLDLPAVLPPSQVATLDAPCPDGKRVLQETLPTCSAGPNSPTATTDDGPARQGGSAELPAQIGRFQVRQCLGEGAFGVVYRAYDPQLAREVAIKVAKASQLSTPERVERFFREARSAAQLRHPNIVPLFETGRHGDGYYIASAFIHGQTLEKAAEQRLDWRTAAQLVRKLAEGVGYAHNEGIIHRDIKPANIMVDGKGEPLLMDFGLAARQGEGQERLTQDGTVMGTPLYMAPEQAEGRLDQVGPASDQYSLGCTLFELLTGRPPFTGPMQAVILSHIKQEAPSPRKLQPKLPRDLETICLKCLEKEPPKRYAGCQALADDLRRWLDGEPVTARPIGWAEWTARWARRNPVVAGLTAALAVVLVGGLIASLAAAVHMRALAAGETAARKDAQEQTREAEQAQEDARARGEELRRQLSRQYVANGERALAAEDTSLALLWFVKALEVDEGDPEREPVHRIRVAATWHRLPRPSGLIRHDLPIRSAELSPDGRLVVTASYDGTARLWRVATGEPVGKVMRHAGYVYCARFSPDGKKVATASGDGTARLWDAATGEPASPPLEHGGAVNHLSFDAAGARIVTACGTPNHLSPPPAGIHPDRDVAPQPGKPLAAIWALSDLTKPVRLELPQGDQPYRAVFSRDGRRVATGGWSRKASVWDAATGKLLVGGLEHKNQITQIALSPDGTKLLTTEYGGRTALWDLTTSPPGRSSLAGPTSLYSANQLEEAQWGDDGSVTWGRMTWDAKSGQLRKERIKEGLFTLHETGVGGKGYLLGCKGDLLQVWEARTGRPVTGKIHRDAANSDIGLLTPDRRFVLVSTADGCGLRALDLAGECAGTLPLLSTGLVSHAVYSPDSTRVAVSHPGLGSVQVYETASGRPLSPSLAQAAPVGDKEWGQMPVAYNADGTRLVAASLNNLTQVWDAHTFRPVGPPIKPTGDIAAVYLAPDGSRLLQKVTRSGQVVYVEGWDLAEHKPLWPPIENKWRGWKIALSPDGRTFATGNANYEVRVWDMHSGKQILPTLWHTYYVASLSYSPDGKWLASTGGDRLVRVWDLADGRPVVSLPLRATGDCVAFSPDGRLLAAGGDFEVKVFDTATWAPLVSLPNQVSRDGTLCFTPDSRLLVGSGDEGRGWVWDARTGETVTPPIAPIAAAWDRQLVLRPRGDSKQLAVSNAAPYALLIDLRPDDRPVSELLRLAEVAAGRRIGPAGAVEELSAAQLQEAFTRLETESPTSLGCGPAEVSAWRRRDIGRLLYPRVFTDNPLPLDEVLPLLSAELKESPDDVFLRGLRAQLYLKQGDFAGMVQDLLEVLPTPQAAQVWWAYFDVAIAQTKGWAAALEVVKRRQAADPTNPRLWRLRGVLRAGLKDHAGAIADYSAAIAGGVDEDVYRQRAELYLESGRWEDARADLRKALDASPANVFLILRMVWVELGRGDQPAIHTALQAAADSADRTSSPHVASQVALLAAIVGHDPARSVALAESALAAMPKDAGVLTSLGANHLRAGDVTKATATLRRALDAEGKGGLCRTWLYLALAHARAGDRTEAERWLRKARDWLGSHKDLDWDDRIELDTLRREVEAAGSRK